MAIEGGRRAYLILLWNSQKWSPSEEAEIVRGKTAELGCSATVLKHVQVPGPFPTGPDSLVVALALLACQEARIPFQSGRDTISFKGGAFAPGVGLGLITILVAGSAASRREATMHKIGILFDIDALGSGLYGYAAYSVFFEAIDTRQLGGCLLRDGDTRATLAGRANQYCIAVESPDPSKIAAVKNALSASNAKGLLPLACRFLEAAQVAPEPLVAAARINAAGELVGDRTGWVMEAWKKSREKHPGSDLTALPSPTRLAREEKAAQPSPQEPPRLARGPDELFCAHCGAIIKQEAAFCPKCGGRAWAATPGARSKNKTVAVLLAVFLGFWTWCYTYKKDAWKFWLNLGLSVVTLGIWSIVAWFWAVIESATRPREFFANLGGPTTGQGAPSPLPAAPGPASEASHLYQSAPEGASSPVVQANVPQALSNESIVDVDSSTRTHALPLKADFLSGVQTKYEIAVRRTSITGIGFVVAGNAGCPGSYAELDWHPKEKSWILWSDTQKTSALIKIGPKTTSTSTTAHLPVFDGVTGTMLGALVDQFSPINRVILILNQAGQKVGEIRAMSGGLGGLLHLTTSGGFSRTYVMEVAGNILCKLHCGSQFWRWGGRKWQVDFSCDYGAIDRQLAIAAIVFRCWKSTVGSE